MHNKNEMMDRPINHPSLVNFMRQNQRQWTGPLKEIQEDANERRVPVIPHETALFLDMILDLHQPKEVLEVGMAIGFSASLMANRPYVKHVDTIDRYDKMVAQAKINFEKMGIQDKVSILEGDAAELLPDLVDQGKSYHFIFMDSAKAKYESFLPYCIDLLEVGGLLMIDDVFQGGTILDDEADIPKRVRKIHRKLNELMDKTLQHPRIKSTLIPLGDGLLMVQKTHDEKFSYEF